MKKRILVISGSPRTGSFSEQLASAYQQGAGSLHEVQLSYLSQMDFNPDLSHGYAKAQPLEPCLQEFQRQLAWAEHIVIFTPVWWGALPAKFKGLFDRTLLPSFAFKYEKGMKMQQKLLSGKTARIILTLDTPAWYFRWIQGAPASKQLQITTLAFCGIKSARPNLYGPMISATEQQRQQWLRQVRQYGQQAL